MNTTLAQSFLYCPRCGKAATSIGQNPFECVVCDYTLYMSPITAVAAILSDADGRVLFLRRAKEPGKGKLGLPGGFVDAGESLEEALRREILEETNLQAKALTYLASFPNLYTYRDIELDVTDMIFLCEVESFESLMAQEGEVDACHFARPTANELEQLAFASNRKALEVFLARR